MTYAKLLYAIRRDHVWGGWSFEGVLHKPGAEIPERELRPSPEYPETPVLLECAGQPPRKWGERRSETVYVVWQYLRQAGGDRRWDEIARASTVGPEWALDLEPAIRRALARPALVRTPADVAQCAARVLAALERELEPLEHNQRAMLLGYVYDEFASRAAEAGVAAAG